MVTAVTADEAAILTDESLLSTYHVPSILSLSIHQDPLTSELSSRLNPPLVPSERVQLPADSRVSCSQVPSVLPSGAIQVPVWISTVIEAVLISDVESSVDQVPLWLLSSLHQVPVSSLS